MKKLTNKEKIIVWLDDLTIYVILDEAVKDKIGCVTFWTLWRWDYIIWQNTILFDFFLVEPLDS